MSRGYVRVGVVIPYSEATSNDHDCRPLEAVDPLELLNATQRSLGVVRVRHRLLNPILVACAIIPHKRKRLVQNLVHEGQHTHIHQSKLYRYIYMHALTLFASLHFGSRESKAWNIKK